ncbi:MAG: tetratricopeptide repeat protein [Burkholderiaceae bacterium]
MPTSLPSLAFACLALLATLPITALAQISSPAQSVPPPAAERVELTELQQVQKLMAALQMQQALARADAHLGRNPRDAQMRFVRGVILSELKNGPGARQVFERLTEEFPELPEPYNNLAVIYASEGQLDRARTLLETALTVRPDYATAHENLGDIYLQMSVDAYQRAAKLQPGNRSASGKLTLTRELLAKTRTAP